MSRINYPDLIALEKKTGSYTVSAVPAGSTSTANCSVILINGGKNEFTVRASNSGASDTDVSVDYEVYVVK